MEILGLLYDGFLIALQPLNITVVIIGVVVGLFIGAVSYTHLTLPTNREV